MAPVDIVAILKERFGPAITGEKLDAIDPWVVVDPVHLDRQQQAANRLDRGQRRHLT